MSFVVWSPEDGEGEASRESSEYMRIPKSICRRLFIQADRLARPFAEAKDINNKAAKPETMAMTTKSSIRENPFLTKKLSFMLFLIMKETRF